MPKNSVTIEEFEGKLTRAGLTKAELARRFQMRPSSISPWGRKTAVPAYAVVYLDLLVDYNRLRP